MEANLPWWAQQLSVVLSVVILPLVGMAVRNARQLRKIRNGGSGLLDEVIVKQGEILKAQGALIEAQKTLEIEVTRLRDERHDLRDKVLTPMLVTIGRLEERTVALMLLHKVDSTNK